jgi:hypothetical protein
MEKNSYKKCAFPFFIQWMLKLTSEDSGTVWPVSGHCLALWVSEDNKITKLKDKQVSQRLINLSVYRGSLTALDFEV